MMYKNIEELREARNKALSDCDYLLLPDSRLDEEFYDLFIAYRQELRDITNRIDELGLENIKLPEFPQVILERLK